MSIKLDQEVLEGKIDEVEYTVVGKKTTICCLTLDSGFEVIGTSCCLNLEDYNEEIGENLAYDNAVQSLLEMEAYHLAELSNNPVSCDGCGCDCDCGCEDGSGLGLADAYEDIEDEEEKDCDCEDDCECEFTRCKCYECESTEDCGLCECNEGCPHVGCPQNEDNDFEGYEDDGTEEEPVHNVEKPESKGVDKTEEMKLVLAIHMVNPTLSFEKVLAMAQEILG